MADINLTIGVETLIGNTGAKILAVIGLLKDLAKAVGETALAGDAFGDAMRASRFELEGLQEATFGEVSALKLFQLTNRAAATGLQFTQEQMENLVRAAKQVEEATGVGMERSLKRLFSAISSGTSDSLIPLGIEVEANATRMEILEQATRQYAAQAEAMGTSSDNAGDATARLTTKWEDLTDRFALGFAESELLTEAISAMEQALGGGEGAATALGDALGELVGFILAAGLQLQAFNRFIERAEQSFVSFALAQANVFSALGFEEAGGRIRTAVAQSAAMRAARAGRAGGGAEVGGPKGVEVSAEAFKAATVGGGRGGGGGGGGRAEEPTGPFAEFVDPELERQAIERGEARVQLLRDVGNREVDVIGEINQETMELARQRAEEEQTRRAERVAAEDEAIRIQAEQDRARIDAARRTARGLGQIALQAAQLFGAGQAEQLVIRGLTEAVLSAVEFAALNPIGGVAHALAAALAFKGATEVGNRAGVGRGGGVGAGAGGGAALPGAGFAGGGGGGGGIGGGAPTNITINFGGTIAGQRDIEDTVVAAVNAAGRRGNRLQRANIED